ncbi:MULTISPECIES: TRAP transporter large permease [Alphaproteobacteria]|uniref:TRAP transporter large permease protein n=2 Tax=Alphaproteobacteria TaxID=28211 RepID=A0A512HKY8_9HYPH|nr:MULTISPECIES: TRAP transporter large permease [Alphaproteobacteria]GEO86112.1 C4-dicarboxylate ABC transporter permease [Ciceribacter naphthalenivorans]GLR22679.1 C4-dicarboxylate ABC transporter permease [Ciceribacter naphthalenivorans]GLT05535.1 C4-dicarboxylate ABC transporter permease [Sphingomonas psychrolutea]
MEMIVLFTMLFGLLFLGAPVAISLGLSSIVTIAFFSSDSMSSIALQLFTAAQNYTLLAIPFFVLASVFMSTGGVAKRLIRFAIAAVGHFRGGLAMASVLSCMLFAALSGSSPATVVAIGTIAIAGMRQVGYSKEFAAGIIANAGTLGILIPPSIVMVVYSAATDVSVGRMFLAGVIPGLIAGVMLMVTIYIFARFRGLPAEPWRGFGEILEGGKQAGWGLFLIIIILGGIYGGVFTPTEAASVAAVYSFFVALFIYRDMGPMKDIAWVLETDSRQARIGFSALVYAVSFFFVWMILSFFATDGVESIYAGFRARALMGLVMALAIAVAYTLWRGENARIGQLPGYIAASLPIWGRNFKLMGRNFFRAFFNEETRKATIDAARTTIMLMFIIVNALLFAHVLTSERIPQVITDLMVGAGFNWFTFLIAVNILLLIGGQFMEPSGLLLIVAPVVFPIAMELGVDPIHLGIIMIVNMEIGMITPPIGLNLFVTSGITGMSLVQVVKAAMPFVAVLFLFLIIVTYVPIISTWLPYAMMGPEITTR